MIQNLIELNDFHKEEDPWGYSLNADDKKRLEILLAQLPKLEYKNVLDIGCGQGFITKHLPGKFVTGVDISYEAINHAKKHSTDRMNFLQGSIFDIVSVVNKQKYSLIIITGVLYDQYIGSASNLIYMLIDEILEKDGVLISVHIEDWYNCQFPYLRVKEMYYPYREFNHKFEVYVK